MMRVLSMALPIGLAVALPAQDIEDFTFDLSTLGGAQISQEQFKNNVLIVDFWGTWCGPCKQAIPSLVELYKKYKHHGLEIVGLNYMEPDGEKGVRIFATQEGITYSLAMGTEKVRAQVPGFRGYPTMLFFKKGLVHDDTHVGFVPGDEKKIETWIRAALGLDGSGKEGTGESEERKQEEADEKEQLPEGVIYKPGFGDTGFAFSSEDLDGKEIRMVDLRGKRVLLALTSTWDREAKSTAAFLQKMQDQHGKQVHVIAACLELKRERGEKVAAMESFRSALATTYLMLPVSLAFGKKIHRFTTLPLLLVFDEEGTLIQRQAGNSTDNHSKIKKALVGS